MFLDRVALRRVALIVLRGAVLADEHDLLVSDALCRTRRCERRPHHDQGGSHLTLNAYPYSGNGNVGVGLAAPAAKFEVRQSSMDAYALTVSSSGPVSIIVRTLVARSLRIASAS